MISDSLLCKALRIETGRWKREPLNDHIRGIIFGLHEALRVVCIEVHRQKEHTPDPPPFLTKDDAWRLLKHIEIIAHLLDSGDRTRAERKARAVVDSYKDRLRRNEAA